MEHRDFKQPISETFHIFGYRRLRCYYMVQCLCETAIQRCYKTSLKTVKRLYSSYTFD